jgi:NAD(P)-dependent dehydrogenase (short-subunit alcohol dehydrogenase family)
MGMTGLLRDALLTDRTVALAGEAGAVRDRLVALGARVEPVPGDLDGLEEEKVGEWARSRTPLHALVVAAGREDVEGVLARAWVAVREVATGALIPAGDGGKIVLLGPQGRGAAVVAALENLARTLSVEWARHGVTVVAVAVGPHAREAEVAEIVSYLVSPAGEYFSGARFDVGLVARAGGGPRTR